MLVLLAVLQLQAAVVPSIPNDSLPTVTLAEALRRATGLDPNYVAAVGLVDNARWARRSAFAVFLLPAVGVETDATKNIPQFFNFGTLKPESYAVSAQTGPGGSGAAGSRPRGRAAHAREPGGGCGPGGRRSARQRPAQRSAPDARGRDRRGDEPRAGVSAGSGQRTPGGGDLPRPAWHPAATPQSDRGRDRVRQPLLPDECKVHAAHLDGDAPDMGQLSAADPDQSGARKPGHFPGGARFRRAFGAARRGRSL